MFPGGALGVEAKKPLLNIGGVAQDCKRNAKRPAVQGGARVAVQAVYASDQRSSMRLLSIWAVLPTTSGVTTRLLIA